MKIGILTFHKSINNGAVLQCYSLTKRLQQEFPNDIVEVIDYHMPKMDRLYTPSFKNFMSGGNIVLKAKKIIKLLLNPNYLKWQKKRKLAFESVKDEIPLSKESIFQDTTDELFKYINENYDIVIAGSDAIWNYVLRGFPNPYFLDTSVNCHKFTYAASCYGMSYELIPEEQRNRIGEILNSYCFLGIRDQESEKFVKYVNSSTPIAHTCDPTAFLDVDDLPIDAERLITKMKTRGFDFSKKTIGVMGPDQMCSMVRKMYAKNVQIVSLYNYNKEADVNLYDLTPYEWAYAFRFFNATITTYFHGTHLSLRNGTPVVCVALETEYSKTHKTKVQDFLERIGLENWYFHSDYKEIGVFEIKKQLDYFLKNDLKADIVSRIDRESKSFNNFLEKMKNYKENSLEDLQK